MAIMRARFDNAVLLLALVVLSVSVCSNSNSGALAASGVTDNVFTQWNGVAQRVVRTAGVPSQIAHRLYAFVALSQYKALQLAYKKELKIPEVAPVYAAHYVLSELFPYLQSSVFDGIIAQYIFPLNLTEEEDAEYQKLALEFAKKLLLKRVLDGSQRWAKFQPAPPGGPTGAYQFVPNQTFVLYPQLGSTDPFVIHSPEDWDIYGPPPKIPSAQYNSDYDTIVTAGNSLSPLQTQYEKDTAKFWEDGSNTSAVGGQLFNATLAIVGPLGLKDTAKLFTKLAVGGYDAQIVTYFLKYKYKSWRPYTAVKQGDSVHPPNPNYATFLKIPPHPEYPSGHSTTGGSFASAVTKFLGISVDDPTPNGPYKVFTESYVLPPRTFKTVTDLLADLDNSRVWAGLHFPTATNVGYRVGFDVSNYVWENFEKKFGDL